MKKLLILLTILFLTVFSCSKSDDLKPTLIGTWTGQLNSEPLNCNELETLTFYLKGISEFYFIDDENCNYELIKLGYIFEDKVLTFYYENGDVSKADILLLNSTHLSLKYFFHTQEGGEYDGQTMELTKIEK